MLGQMGGYLRETGIIQKKSVENLLDKICLEINNNAIVNGFFQK